MDDDDLLDCTQALPDLWDDGDDNDRDADGQPELLAWLQVGDNSYEVYEGETKIGRDSETCKIVLSQKVLSKEHAILEVASDVHTLADLGSTNKTRIGKMALKPLVRYALQGGEKISFGDVKAIYKIKPKGDADDSGSETGSESMLQFDDSGEQPSAADPNVSGFILGTQEKKDTSSSSVSSPSTCLKKIVPESPSLSQSTPLPQKKVTFVAETPANTSRLQNVTNDSLEESFIFESSQPAKVQELGKKVESCDSKKVGEGYNSDASTDIEDDDVPTQLFDTSVATGKKNAEEKREDFTDEDDDVPTQLFDISDGSGKKNAGKKSENVTDEDDDVPTQLFDISDGSGKKNAEEKSENMTDDDDDDIFNQATQYYSETNVSPRIIGGGKPEDETSEVNNDNTQDILDAFDDSMTGNQPSTSFTKAQYEEDDDDDGDDDDVATQLFFDDETPFKKPLMAAPKSKKKQSLSPNSGKMNNESLDADIFDAPTQLYGEHADEDIFDAPTQPFNVETKMHQNEESKEITKHPVPHNDDNDDDVDDIFNQPTQIYTRCDESLGNETKPTSSNRNGDEADDDDIDDFFNQPTQPYVREKNDDMSDAPTQLFNGDLESEKQNDCVIRSKMETPRKSDNLSDEDFTPTQPYRPKPIDVTMKPVEDEEDEDDLPPTQLYTPKQTSKNIPDMVDSDDGLSPTQIYDPAKHGSKKVNDDDEDGSFLAPTQPYVKCDMKGGDDDDEDLPPTQIFTKSETTPGSNQIVRRESTKSFVLGGNSNGTPQTTHIVDDLTPTQPYHQGTKRKLDICEEDVDKRMKVLDQSRITDIDEEAPTQPYVMSGVDKVADTHLQSASTVAERACDVDAPKRTVSELWDDIDADATQDIDIDGEIGVEEAPKTVHQPTREVEQKAIVEEETSDVESDASETLLKEDDLTDDEMEAIVDVKEKHQDVMLQEQKVPDNVGVINECKDIPEENFHSDESTDVEDDLPSLGMQSKSDSDKVAYENTSERENKDSLQEDSSKTKQSGGKFAAGAELKTAGVELNSVTPKDTKDSVVNEKAQGSTSLNNNSKPQVFVPNDMETEDFMAVDVFCVMSDEAENDTSSDDSSSSDSDDVGGGIKMSQKLFDLTPDGRNSSQRKMSQKLFDLTPGDRKSSEKKKMGSGKLASGVNAKRKLISDDSDSDTDVSLSCLDKSPDKKARSRSPVAVEDMKFKGSNKVKNSRESTKSLGEGKDIHITPITEIQNSELGREEVIPGREGQIDSKVTEILDPEESHSIKEAVRQTRKQAQDPPASSSSSDKINKEHIKDDDISVRKSSGHLEPNVKRSIQSQRKQADDTDSNQKSSLSVVGAEGVKESALSPKVRKSLANMCDVSPEKNKNDSPSSSTNPRVEINRLSGRIEDDKKNDSNETNEEQISGTAKASRSSRVRKSVACVNQNTASLPTRKIASRNNAESKLGLMGNRQRLKNRVDETECNDSCGASSVSAALDAGDESDSQKEKTEKLEKISRPSRSRKSIVGEKNKSSAGGEIDSQKEKTEKLDKIPPSSRSRKSLANKKNEGSAHENAVDISGNNREGISNQARRSRRNRIEDSESETSSRETSVVRKEVALEDIPVTRRSRRNSTSSNPSTQSRDNSCADGTESQVRSTTPTMEDSTTGRQEKRSKKIINRIDEDIPSTTTRRSRKQTGDVKKSYTRGQTLESETSNQDSSVDKKEVVLEDIPVIRRSGRRNSTSSNLSTQSRGSSCSDRSRSQRRSITPTVEDSTTSVRQGTRSKKNVGKVEDIPSTTTKPSVVSRTRGQKFESETSSQDSSVSNKKEVLMEDIPVTRRSGRRNSTSSNLSTQSQGSNCADKLQLQARSATPTGEDSRTSVRQGTRSMKIVGKSEEDIPSTSIRHSRKQTVSVQKSQREDQTSDKCQEIKQNSLDDGKIEVDENVKSSSRGRKSSVATAKNRKELGQSLAAPGKGVDTKNEQTSSFKQTNRRRTRAIDKTVIADDMKEESEKVSCENISNDESRGGSSSRMSKKVQKVKDEEASVLENRVSSRESLLGKQAKTITTEDSPEVRTSGRSRRKPTRFSPEREVEISASEEIKKEIRGRKHGKVDSSQDSEDFVVDVNKKQSRRLTSVNNLEGVAGNEKHAKESTKDEERTDSLEDFVPPLRETRTKGMKGRNDDSITRNQKEDAPVKPSKNTQTSRRARASIATSQPSSQRSVPKVDSRHSLLPEKISSESTIDSEGDLLFSKGIRNKRQQQVGTKKTSRRQTDILPSSKGPKKGSQSTLSEEEDSESSQDSKGSTIYTPNSKPKNNQGSAKNSPFPGDKVLWSPSQRQQQASNKPRVIFTGYKDASDERIVTDLGGKVVESAQACTVLVTTSVKRTCKLLAVMGKGMPIVSPSWLVASRQARNFVNPWEYLVKDTEAETKFGFRLEQSLRSASKYQLFEGLEIHATKSVKPPPEQMKEIIECSGGQYIDMPPKRYSPQIRVVSCPEDKGLWKIFQRVGIPILGTEFILTGLLRHQLLLDDFILK